MDNKALRILDGQIAKLEDELKTHSLETAIRTENEKIMLKNCRELKEIRARIAS
jgi:hypothetical protein